MKLKTYEILNIYTSAKNIVDDKNFTNISIKFKMLGVLKNIETYVSNFETIQLQKIKEYGKPKLNENGEETGNYFIPKEDVESIENYKNDMNALFETQIEVNIDTFKASDIFNNGISSKDLMNLYPIIEGE